MRTKAGVFFGFFAGLLLAPAWVAAEGPIIDHAAVGCIVAEQYPKLSACFTPAADLARARVFFRAGGTEVWYFVDFRPEAPCFQAILPKPRKTIKQIEYYVWAVDNAYLESRTSQIAADVVPDRGACRKDVLAAPYTANASVTVGSVAAAPAVPFGFGIGAGISGTTLGIGALGLGAAGGTLYGLTGGDSGGGTGGTGGTGGIGGTGPSPSPSPSPSPTPTPTPGSGSPNQPPNAVFGITPDPPEGSAPLTVKFSMCGSSDPDPNDNLSYSFDFGDGHHASGGCATTHTYTDPSAARRALVFGYYAASQCVTDGVPGHEECKNYKVKVGPGSCPDPTVAITSPASGEAIYSCPFTITATASGGTIDLVRFTATTGLGSETIGEVTSPPFRVTWDAVGVSGDVTLGATASNTCGNSTTASTLIYVYCGGYVTNPTGNGRRVSWIADLSVPDSRGELVLNGNAASFPGTGRAFGLGEAVKGENRIQGRLVESGPTAGTWRFDFGNSPLFEPGSIRVTAGSVISVTAHAVVFRMSGRIGEQIAFTFRTKD